MPAPTDSATGLKVEVEGKDSSGTSEVHPDQLYVRHRHGSVYLSSINTVTDPTSATSIGDGDGTHVVGASDGTTPAAAFTVTADEPGDYLCEVYGVFEGEGDGDIVTLQLAVDGTVRTGEGKVLGIADIGDTGQPVTLIAKEVLTLTAGQVVAAYVTNSNTSNVIVYNNRLGIVQLASTNYATPL